MHLRNGGGGHRLAKLYENRIEFRVKRRLDRRHRHIARERRHAILQQFQLLDDRWSDDILTGGQKLAELYIRRPELCHGIGEAFGRSACILTAQKFGKSQRQARFGRGEREVDIGEHALARQNETGAGKAGEMKQC